MNLNHLKTFVLVVEKKSFSGAAKTLFLTQPAVTLQIQTLEENLGMQLLIRKGKSIMLTEAGEILFAKARKILEIWEDTKGEIYRISKVVKGKLILGASTIPGEYILPQLIGEFHNLYPEVEAALEIGNTEEIVERTLIGEIDLGIIGSFTSHDKLEISRFAQDEIVLVVPPNHPWGREKEITLEQVKEQPFISRYSGSGTRAVMEKHLKKHGLETKQLKVIMELGTSEAVISAVEGGWGVAFLSSLAAEKALKYNRIKKVDIKDFSIKRDFYLIFSALKAKKAVVREFIKFSQKVNN